MENDIKNGLVIVNHDTALPSPKLGFTNPYIQLATSTNTRKAYRSDIRHYESWGGKLPAMPEMIASYLHEYANVLNSRTLARRLIAIKHWHTYQGFPDPTIHPVIKKTISGIQRAHGKPKDKAHPLTPDELFSIHQHLLQENTFTAIRDDALLQLGFFGAFRRSELVAICYEHIQWSKAGIEILIPQSKTDQLHDGQFCAIPNGNASLCPIKTLKKWLDVSGIKEGPVFRRISISETMGDNALTPQSVTLILKHRAKETNGIDVARLSSHSLRRGLATAAAQAGSPIQVIMRAGRWKQMNTVLEYIEASDRFKENAATDVLGTLNYEYK